MPATPRRFQAAESDHYVAFQNNIKNDCVKFFLNSQISLSPFVKAGFMIRLLHGLLQQKKNNIKLIWIANFIAPERNQKVSFHGSNWDWFLFNFPSNFLLGT